MGLAEAGLVDVDHLKAGVLDVGRDGEVDEKVGAVAVGTELVGSIDPIEICLVPACTLATGDKKYIDDMEVLEDRDDNDALTSITGQPPMLWRLSRRGCSPILSMRGSFIQAK